MPITSEFLQGTLVYLDTNHLSLLGDLLKKKDPTLDKFFETWNARGHLLAISRAHVYEMDPTGGHSSEWVKLRLDLLSRFPKVIYGYLPTHELVEHELVVQLTERISGAPPKAGPRYGFVHQEFWRIATSSQLAGIRARQTRNIEKWRGHWIASVPLMERERARQQEYERQNAPITSAKLVRLADSLGVGFYRCVPKGDVTGVLQIAFWTARLRGFFEWTAQHFGLRENEMRAALANLDWYDMPAWSYGTAFIRAFARSTKDAETGDAYDSDHVPGMAYADVVFTDKRVAGWLTQEQQHRTRSKLLSRHVAPSFLRAQTPEEILSRIDAHAHRNDMARPLTDPSAFVRAGDYGSVE